MKQNNFMQYSNLDHPLKNEILGLIASSGTDKMACYKKMLNYTIELFENEGLGNYYYGYHNIDHELEVTYITLLASTKEQRIQKLSQSDVEHLYAAALFHDFDPQKSVDKPHEESVIRFIMLDKELEKLFDEAKLDFEIITALILRTTYPWSGELKTNAEGQIRECFARSEITKNNPEKQSHYEDLGWFLSVADRIGGYAIGDFSISMEKAKKNAHALGWHPSLIVKSSVNYFEYILNNESKMSRRVLQSLPEEIRKNFINSVLSFMNLRQQEIRLESKFVYDNLKFVTTIDSAEVRNSTDFGKDLISIYNELPTPLQFQRVGFTESIKDPETILVTLRVNDDNGTIAGFAKGGHLENYQLRSEVKDENFGKRNTVFLEPIAMKMGYWGLGGGSQLRRQFSIQARAKNYKHLTSFALRDLIQEKIGTSENVEFVTLIDPEHWDYYRAEL
jgi:hypothetical protein